jgi:hypothetical protein
MGYGKNGNLIPNSERTPSELREMTSKGGKRSGEVRRENKTLREIAKIIGEKPITITNPDGTKETVTYNVAMLNAQYKKAITEGNTKAAEFIAKLRGEMEDKVSLDGSVQGLTVTVTNPDTAEKLEKILK